MSDIREQSPAMMVEHATPANAAELADLLTEMLSDERVPDPMRRDIRSRISDLYRRFPDSFDE
jgi:hypothetical protein